MTVCRPINLQRKPHNSESMRNLWIFINRYNAFFLLIIFLTAGIVLTVKNNAYQRSVTINSSNEIVGNAYEKLNVLKKYANLGNVNDSLAAENAQLYTQLLKMRNIDSAKNIDCYRYLDPAAIYLPACQGH